ncbi:MAG: hypothetical protein JWL62_2732 [Hyphomicrobiales bacterium]|nr:hypothetical protein [Hyphomicrobiales bacterium]
MASIISRIGKSDVLCVAATVFAIMVLGIGVAGAAITLNPDASTNPAMRPLTISRSTQLVPAFGPDDEDCVYAIHKVRLPNGTTKATRELVCGD